MVIRTSSAKAIDALVTDLTSESAVTRESAIARLTVLGSRAVERLLTLVRSDSHETPSLRIAVLRALEAIGDSRALDPALKALSDPDPDVAGAAVAIARTFLRSRHGPAALDRLTALALDRASEASVRVAAVTALADLDASTLKPLWKSLGEDPNPDMRALAARMRDPRGAGRQPRTSPADQLALLAQRGVMDDPDGIRRLIGSAGRSAPLAVLHRIVERLREREQIEPEGRRAEWTRTRGAAHAALAGRGSRLALYDVRESLEAAKRPLPADFLNALSLVGDASCLDAIAAAHEQSADAWWRGQLAGAFRAIVTRGRLTRRHAAVKKLEKKWGRTLDALWAGKPGP